MYHGNNKYIQIMNTTQINTRTSIYYTLVNSISKMAKSCSDKELLVAECVGIHNVESMEELPTSVLTGLNIQLLRMGKSINRTNSEQLKLNQQMVSSMIACRENRK